MDSNDINVLINNSYIQIELYDNYLEKYLNDKII